MRNRLPSVFRYKLQYLPYDMVAAIVVTAVTVPSALALAAIVGVPPVMGLYAAMIAPIMFGLLAHTRRLVVGPNSPTAILVASGAALVAAAGTAEYVNAVFVLGLIAGAILILLGAARFGFLSDLISRPVMIGFLAGVGVQIVVTQLAALLGVKVAGHGEVWHYIGSIMSQTSSINGMTVTVSILVIGTMIVFHRTRVPGELVGLIVAALFAIIFHVQDFGVAFAGELPRGLPRFTLPHIDFDLITVLLPTALSIVVVSLVQATTMIRNLASDHDEEMALNRDFVALGVSSIATSLFQGFLANATPSRTQAASNAGMRSQMTNILSGIMVGGLLLWGGSLFRYVPQAALAAIVCVIGFQLIRFRELRNLWMVRYEEFVVAMIALVCTVLFGVQLGVLIAVTVSLMERLRRQYRPHDTILLRDGVLSDWAKERLGREQKIPRDVLVYGFDESLFFENVNYFVARLKRAIMRARHAVRYVVIDAGAIDDIDYTAIEELKRLYRELSEDGIAIAFAHMSPSLRAQFDIYGMTDIIGERNLYATLTKALAHPASPPAREMVLDLNLDPTQYVVVGGAVLDMLHLRDTHDVDIVVSNEIYEQFRAQKTWHEVTWTSGKRVLVRGQYTLMKTWMGWPLRQLQRDAERIEQIPCVSTERLIDAKRRIGRRKDISDITLLRSRRSKRRLQ